MKQGFYSLLFVLGVCTTQVSEAAGRTESERDTDPQTVKGRRSDFIEKLYHAFDPICRQYGINTKVAISQAIAEQGWNLTKGYRIFNIAAGTNSKSARVFDNGERRYRRYKVYESLSDAVEDYCKVLNSHKSYTRQGLFMTQDPHKQLKAIVKGGYATNRKYGSLTSEILKKYVSPVIDRLNAQKEQDFFFINPFLSYSSLGAQATR